MLQLVNEQEAGLDITPYGDGGIGAIIAELKEYCEEGSLVSCVGHPDMAKLISADLKMDIPFNRETVCLEDGDVLFVAQYTGPRLPEGATSLPEGAKIRYYRIQVEIV